LEPQPAISDVNLLRLSAKVTGKEAMRYTPAGIAVSILTLQYQGQTQEAGALRQVEFEITAHALGQVAQQVQTLQLGQIITAKGFLAPARKGAKQLRLHITQIE
jgi:primosomal replication protein N